MPHNTFHYMGYGNPVNLRSRLRDLHLSDFPTNASKVKAQGNSCFWWRYGRCNIQGDSRVLVSQQRLLLIGCPVPCSSF